MEKMPQDILDRGNQYEIDRFMFENGVDLKFTGERTKRGFWIVGSTVVGVLKVAKVKNLLILLEQLIKQPMRLSLLLRVASLRKISILLDTT